LLSSFPNIWTVPHFQTICVLAARILRVDFVVCTLTVNKKNRGRFRHVGSDHSLVSMDEIYRHVHQFMHGTRNLWKQGQCSIKGEVEDQKHLRKTSIV
jgi:hypothetical protein